MQSPLPQLTALLLLIHVGYGCCLHHAHACELGVHSREATGRGSCEPHCHSSADCDESVSRWGLTAHDEPHSHACGGHDCSFVADPSRLVIAIDEASQPAALVVSALGEIQRSSRHVMTVKGAAAEFASSRSPRVHLALQVWQL